MDSVPTKKKPQVTAPEPAAAPQDGKRVSNSAGGHSLAVLGWETQVEYMNWPAPQSR